MYALLKFTLGSLLYFFVAENFYILVTPYRDSSIINCSFAKIKSPFDHLIESKTSNHKG